jgi:hypothetical protein
LDDRLGLLDDLRTSKCTVSIVTTYSVDFHFYEAVVLRKLNAAGCEHHLLLVDAQRCGEALADPQRRPKLAGISYALIPVAYRGAFHPKMIVLVGKKASRVYVGSHNLTFPGFGGNAEVTNCVAGTGTESLLVSEALDAVRSWVIGHSNGPASEILTRASSLLGTPKAPGDDRLLHGGVGRAALWDQLRAFLPPKIHRVAVLGPFFDDRLRFVQRVHADTAADEVVIGIDPAYTTINAAEARCSGARFVDARLLLSAVGFAESSSLHAKMMLVEGDDQCVLISGSANPSAAAWLDSGTNAEAVLVRHNVTDSELEALGVRRLYDAPEITSAQWSEIAGRARSDGEESVVRSANALAATEEGNRLVIEGIAQRPTQVRLHFGDGGERHVGVDRHDSPQVVLDDASLDLSSCTLVEIPGSVPIFAVVNHVGSLSPRTGGGGAGDLRAALGAVSDDPSRIEEVLRLVERAIDEADVVGGEPLRPRGEREGDGPQPALGPRAIKLEDVRRRHTKPRSLATGDISVLIDLLIRRIGEGLGPGAAQKPPPEVEESELDPIEEAARAGHSEIDGHALLKACHRKVGRLVRRMIERLDVVQKRGSGAARAMIQLAAVLGVLRWLRRIERQLPWLPLGETLIPQQPRDDLFLAAATHLGLSRPSLIDLAQMETDEPFEELALASGLVAWLGREAQVDLRALPKHPDEDELPEFYWAGALVAILARVVVDEGAMATLTNAIGESRGVDRQEWLDAHLHVGHALAAAEASPVDVKVAKRPVRRGDVVRVTMLGGKVSFGFIVDLDDTKVRLADADHEDGRPVLRKFVVPLDLSTSTTP